MKGCWVPHDIRDQIVDFVRRWSDKTEIATFVIVAWIGISLSKFHHWRGRYGKVNVESQPMIPWNPGVALRNAPSWRNPFETTPRKSWGASRKAAIIATSDGPWSRNDQSKRSVVSRMIITDSGFG